MASDRWGSPPLSGVEVLAQPLFRISSERIPYIPHIFGVSQRSLFEHAEIDRWRLNKELGLPQLKKDTFFSIDYGRIVAFITQKGVPTSVHHFIQLFEGHDAAVP